MLLDDLPAGGTALPVALHAFIGRDLDREAAQLAGSGLNSDRSALYSG